MSISSLFIPNSYQLQCGSLQIKGNPVQQIIAPVTLSVPLNYGAVAKTAQNCKFTKYVYGTSLAYVTIEIPGIDLDVSADTASIFTLVLTDSTLAKYVPFNDTDNQLITVLNNNVQGAGNIQTEGSASKITIGNGFNSAVFTAANHAGLPRTARFTYRSVV